MCATKLAGGARLVFLVIAPPRRARRDRPSFGCGARALTPYFGRRAENGKVKITNETLNAEAVQDGPENGRSDRNRK